jgi:predicted kinase
MIVVMAGLPGTGKSTLARALAAELGGVVLSKDLLRAVLFPEAFVEYCAEQDDFCQDLMLRTAQYLINRHPDLTVLLDGRTFSKTYQIENAIETARRLNTQWRIIECVCSEETAQQRIESDHTHPARNRTFDLYTAVRSQFEPIILPKLVVDTDQPLETCVEYVLTNAS